MEEIEKEIEKETEEIAKENENFANKEKEKKINNLEPTHKEGFSLKGNDSNKKAANSSSNENNSKGETQSDSSTMNNYFGQYYMYNPMTPGNMDPKQMNQMYYFYPVYMDPTKMPKDMNGQNMMFFPPMMGMYPPNFGEQGYMQNTNTKKYHR